MTLAPKSTAAFDALIATLQQLRDEYVLNSERHIDELETVEGFRYATHVVSEAIDLMAEGDPARPIFTSIVTPGRKFLGDNPDSIYFQCRIRDDRGYRITGRKDRQSYISFTVHGEDPAGGINGPVLADINDADFDLQPDGSFELILSPQKQPGSWLEMPPGAHHIFVRNYYLQEESAQSDPTIHVELDIKPIDDPGPAPVLTDEVYAERLNKAVALVRASTLGLRVFGATAATVPFVSDVPNTVGTPWSFRSSRIDAAGAVDIFYSSGSFDLQPDEAIVMEGTLPESNFTNVMLWNVHMQTLEYRSRRSSLNSAQMVTGPGNTYRIVISAQDLGVPNWLDTEGHQRGTIFWRFLLPETDPELPRCRVVKTAEVAGLPVAVPA